MQSDSKEILCTVSSQTLHIAIVQPVNRCTDEAQISFCFSACTEYDTDESVNYKLRQSYNSFTTMGADVRILTAGQDDAREEEEEGDSEAQEDFHALLVKAWESKVFPVIRRRFRNEAERRSGLEQIKGALQLGRSSSKWIRLQDFKWMESTHTLC